MSVIPAPTASSITYWIVGLSTTGSISFGCALVAGRNRGPSPAAGITALVSFIGPKVSAVYGAPARWGNPLETELVCSDHAVPAARLGLVHRFVGSIDQS